MKNLLLAALLFCSLGATAQIMGKSVPEYTSKTGTAFHKGDTLRLGLGTDIAGRFKYITIPPNALLGERETTPLSRDFANRSMVIHDLRLQKGNKRISARTVAVIKTGGFNAAVDLEAAEEAAEIRTSHSGRIISPQPASVAPASIADELLKLKNLLDAKAITQQEYDAQKPNYSSSYLPNRRCVQ